GQNDGPDGDPDGNPDENGSTTPEDSGATSSGDTAPSGNLAAVTDSETADDDTPDVDSSGANSSNADDGAASDDDIIIRGSMTEYADVSWSVDQTTTFGYLDNGDAVLTGGTANWTDFFSVGYTFFGSAPINDSFSETDDAGITTTATTTGGITESGFQHTMVDLHWNQQIGADGNWHLTSGGGLTHSSFNDKFSISYTTIGSSIGDDLNYGFTSGYANSYDIGFTFDTTLTVVAGHFRGVGTGEDHAILHQSSSFVGGGTYSSEFGGGSDESSGSNSDTPANPAAFQTTDGENDETDATTEQPASIPITGRVEDRAIFVDNLSYQRDWVLGPAELQQAAGDGSTHQLDEWTATSGTLNGDTLTDLFSHLSGDGSLTEPVDPELGTGSNTTSIGFLQESGIFQFGEWEADWDTKTDDWLLASGASTMTVTARDELEFRVQGEFEGTTIVTGPLDGDDDDLQNNEGSNSGGEGEGSTTDLPNALSDGGSADSGSGENSSAGYDIDSNGDNADGQEIGTTTTIRNGDWDIGIEDKSLISTTVNQSVSDGKWRITGGTSIVDISSRSWNDVFFWTHVTISADQFHVTVESTIDSYSDSGFGLFTTSQLDANAANAYLDSQDDSEQLDGGNNEESDSPNGQTQSISDGGSQSGDVDHAPNSPGAPTPSDYADQTSPLDASSTGSGSSDAINDPSSLVDTSSGSSNGDGNTDGQPNDGQPNGGDSIDEGDAPDNLWQIVSGSAYAYANIDDFVSFDMDGTFWDYSDPEITIDGGFGNNVSDHLKIGRRVDSIWGDPDSDPAAVFDADGENTDGNDTSNDDTSSDSDWVTWGSGHFSLDSEAGSYYFLDVLFSGSDEDTSYTGGMHIYTDDSYVSRLWTMESLAAGTADDDNQWQFDGGGGFATITSNLFTHTHV
ncbi:MAG: hypothetical protein AAFP90_13485, partial [Planctomycetota bacterium]